jgi:hypothetical protein
VVRIFWEETPICLRHFLDLLSPLSIGMKRLKLCLTMPWALTPALLVLWGVCWMFYYGLGNGSSGDSGWDLQSALGESSNQGGTYQPALASKQVANSLQILES